MLPLGKILFSFSGLATNAADLVLLLCLCHKSHKTPPEKTIQNCKMQLLFTVPSTSTAKTANGTFNRQIVTALRSNMGLEVLSKPQNIPFEFRPVVPRSSPLLGIISGKTILQWIDTVRFKLKLHEFQVTVIEWLSCQRKDSFRGFRTPKCLLPSYIPALWLSENPLAKTFDSETAFILGNCIQYRQAISTQLVYLSPPNLKNAKTILKLIASAESST